MRKLLAIAWKDLTLLLRDRAALVLMLAAPFALTLGLGFVTGRFSGDSGSGLADIPVVVVNEDEGALGDALVDLLSSDDLAGLLAPSTAPSAEAARAQVEEDEAAAAVIIPSGFTAGVIPAADTGQAGAPVAIEVYANPARPVGAGVVQTVVEAFLSQVETGVVGSGVAVRQLIASGRLTPEQAPAVASGIGTQLVKGQEQTSLVRLNTTAAEQGQDFDLLAYFAPGMAMLFLMYTVTAGGRSLLDERYNGTLARVLTTSSSAPLVLGGKVVGVFAAGAAQVGVLVLGTSLMFGLRWGDPLGVAALIAAVALAATGWGLLLAAVARTPSQVSSVGTALMLLFGILSGTFGTGANMPGWLRVLRLITPNAWGLDGFTDLALGATLAEVALPLAALVVMAAVLFAAAVMMFRTNRTFTRG